MDEYNRHLLQTSYEAVARDLPKGELPDVEDVSAEMGRRWLGHRDMLIDTWTWRALENVPAERLAYLTQIVWEYAVDQGFCWEHPGENNPEWTACALAILRWWHQECTCRAPLPVIGDDEIQTWLDHHAYPVHETEGQLSLLAYAQTKRA